MNNRTVTILVGRPKDAVFDFLSNMSNIENLPAWVTEFCEELKRRFGAR